MLKDLDSLLAAAVVVAATTTAPACGDSGGSTETAVMTSDTGTTAGCPTAGCPGTTAGCPSTGIPTNSADLLPWLEAGSYEGWPAESGIHAATNGSPHGDVRVFINDTLNGSLTGGNTAHPMGSAAVKELYTDDMLTGWAVSVKTQEDSDGGNGWYWYGINNDSVLADGNGEGGCAGCHAGGVDYFTTNFPLE